MYLLSSVVVASRVFVDYELKMLRTLYLHTFNSIYTHLIVLISHCSAAKLKIIITVGV